MWLVALFMIAAVFGNPEGWCNTYFLNSFKKKRQWFFFLLLLTLVLPITSFSIKCFIKLGISNMISCIVTATKYERIPKIP